MPYSVPSLICFLQGCNKLSIGALSWQLAAHSACPTPSAELLPCPAMSSAYVPRPQFAHLAAHMQSGHKVQGTRRPCELYGIRSLGKGQRGKGRRRSPPSR